MNVRRALIVLALLVAAWGRAEAGRMVVLADFSQANADLWQCYEDAASRVVLSLRPGDRFNFGGFAVDDKDWFPVRQNLMSRPGYANAQKRLLGQQIRIYLNRLRQGEFKSESDADLEGAVRQAADLLRGSGSDPGAATLVVLSSFAGDDAKGLEAHNVRFDGVRVLGVACPTSENADAKPAKDALKSWESLVKGSGGRWRTIRPDQLDAALAAL